MPYLVLDGWPAVLISAIYAEISDLSAAATPVHLRSSFTALRFGWQRFHWSLGIGRSRIVTRSG